MRLVIQRTAGVKLRIEGRPHSECGPGLLILFGSRSGDTEKSCAWLADKAVNLRIFEDDQGKMNLSALDLKAEVMIVSQFTLYADCRKGRRPSYNHAQEPVEAERLYDIFVDQVKESGLNVATGVFGAMMEVEFTNMGPVTVIVDHDL
ncbi:MAG TPA: D-aminoacyl-tRNA deacylase [candidate division Zixibacteria bacterium]|nr:D-aminoacyl-tRNA deacylase [candidate division Zixibacteria bacterium]